MNTRVKRLALCVPLLGVVAACGSSPQSSERIGPRADPSPSASEDIKRGLIENPVLDPTTGPPVVPDPQPTSCYSPPSPTFAAATLVPELANRAFNTSASGISTMTVPSQGSTYTILAGLAPGATANTGKITVDEIYNDACAHGSSEYQTEILVPGAHGAAALTGNSGTDVGITNADGTTLTLHLLNLSLT